MGFIGAKIFAVVDQLRKLDGDTLIQISRFLIRAGQSPDPNKFVQQSLQRILDESDRPPAPRTVRATATEVKR